MEVARGLLTATSISTTAVTAIDIGCIGEGFETAMTMLRDTSLALVSPRTSLLATTASPDLHSRIIVTEDGRTEFKGGREVENNKIADKTNTSIDKKGLTAVEELLFVGEVSA